MSAYKPKLTHEERYKRRKEIAYQTKMGTSPEKLAVKYHLRMETIRFCCLEHNIHFHSVAADAKKERNEKIEKAALNGKTIPELVVQFNLNPLTIREILKRKGIRADRSLVGDEKKRRPEWKDVNWSLSLREIAKIMGVSIQRVHQVKQQRLAGVR